MDTRELIILLLGLAIVAVVLRGFYVALQARRGQIRISIDKNIPHYVDLDALELAELPGGGARVVARSLQQVNSQNLEAQSTELKSSGFHGNAIETAATRAESLDLGDTDIDETPIPILMDAVELAAVDDDLDEAMQDFVLQGDAEPLDEAGESDGVGEDPDSVLFDYSENEGHDEESNQEQVSSDEVEDEDWHEAGPAIGTAEEAFADDDEDSFADDDENAFAEDHQDELEDTGEREDVRDPEDARYPEDAYDSLAGVTPDYADSPASEIADDTEDALIDNAEDAQLEGDGEHFADDEEVVEVATEAYGEEQDQRAAPASNTEFEDGLGDFPMTAGERIGSAPALALPLPQATPVPELNTQVQQSGLFDDTEDSSDSESPKDKPLAKLKGLFATLWSRRGAAFSKLAESGKAGEEAGETVSEVIIETSHEANLAEMPEKNVPISAEVEPQGLDARIDVEGTPTVQSPRISQRVTEINAANTSTESHSNVLSEPAEVMVINVTAPQGRVFAGEDLMHVLITAGLKFGDMNIFHQRLTNNSKSPIVFSVANILNPGTFDLNNMAEFSTMGISLFLPLPSVTNNLQAFEQMLSVAEQVRSALSGELRDDARNGMTPQTIGHYRQRIRDFELRRLKAVGN